MAIALLCNLLDRRSCFLQTLLGLFAFANGLRDKGFQSLGMFRILPSIQRIRNHGKHWAAEQKLIHELDVKKFWRVTVDNLEFKMAFAKKIFSGVYQKRKLHFLTGQVLHHFSPAEPCPTACQLASCEVSRLPKSLQELDFLDLTISERAHYCKFASTVLSVIVSTDRLFCKPLECSQSLFQVLWTRLELFTC